MNLERVTDYLIILYIYYFTREKVQMLLYDI